MPDPDSAVGSRPLSRFAMQIARVVPPPTGPNRSTAQLIRRRMKCCVDSDDRRARSQGPLTGETTGEADAVTAMSRGSVTTATRNRFGTAAP